MNPNILTAFTFVFAFFEYLAYAGLQPASRGDASRACNALQSKYANSVFYLTSVQYLSTQVRYMSNTVQAPRCVFVPSSPQQLSHGMKLIGEQRVPFAVSSGRHASNIGFSSTTGIQIDLKGFQNVALAADKSYVDIGSGNIWDNVYAALEGSGVNIVGGRVTGVGVGGFIAGGCGYSWKTNQYGLSCDTLMQADMVLPNGTLITATPDTTPDLFWAIKGGGNRFGIVYNWRLKTYPQTKVYGGVRTYTVGQLEYIAQATVEFQAQSKDNKAQVLPTFNFVLGEPLVSLLGFYDGPNPGNALDAFNHGTPLTNQWKVRDFGNLVTSTPSNDTGNTRGLFHTVSVKNLTLPIMMQVINQTKFWGTRLLRSDTFISYDVEPFAFDYSRNAIDSAWPHNSNGLPINIYYAWALPTDDDFYHAAAIESARVLTETAIADGQQLDGLSLYPNYALAGTPVAEMYGGNVQRLASVEQAIDPNNVMKDLTTFFDFE